MLQRIQYAISHKSFQKKSGTVEVDEYESHFRKPGKGRTGFLELFNAVGSRTTVIDNIGHQTLTPLVQKHVEGFQSHVRQVAWI